MKNIIPSNLWNFISSKLEKFIPKKFHKWAVPGLALILVLLLVLVCCSGKDAPAAEPVVCTVSVQNLNVHKEYDPDSSIISQLPVDLEIRIQEQKNANGIDWGRIEKMKLSDGTRIKAGWINLEYVQFPGEEEPEVIETLPPEPATEPVTITLPDPDAGITTMGTVTTGKLHVRKGAGTKYEAFDSYLEGDRVEIQEIVFVEDTEWGFTGKGWVGMGYVRLDGSVVPEGDIRLISDGSRKVLGYGVVNLGELNVRSGPGTEYDKVATVKNGIRYAYYQVIEDWVRIESGWVSNDYFYVEGTSNSDIATTGVITHDDVNIRTGPATTFKSLSTVKTGDTIEVLARVGGWYYTPDGWINMTYVQLNDPIYTTGTGTVTIGLNIRKAPDAESDLEGTYAEGDRVTVTEVEGNWGKTDKGWINLKYVDFD